MAAGEWYMYFEFNIFNLRFLEIAAVYGFTFVILHAIIVFVKIARQSYTKTPKHKKERGLPMSEQQQPLCYRGVNECAKALGISPRTLKQLYAQDHSFPYVKIGKREKNGLCLFPVREIEKWLHDKATATRGGEEHE